MHRRHGRRPAFETLESRTLLDASGVVWGTAPQLTLSFAPDGTEIAGKPSELFGTFDAVASEDAWQETILRAFQTWSVHTNADIGVVDDGGQPFGTPGPTRRDDRFGDIRIGAIPMDPAVVAISIPSDGVVAGTWVGDVLINSNAGLQSLDDLFSVALHEAGHVFGLDHNNDPLSPMHVHGVSSAIVPTATDIAALQSLFGTRAPDINEAGNSGGGQADNNSLGKATELRVPEVGLLRDGSAPSIIYGDLQNAQDDDFFVIDTPDGYAGPVTFQLRSRGISLLAPRLTITNEDQVVVGSADGNGTGGALLTVQIPPSQLESKFFIQVSSVDDGIYATGGYSLVATFDANLTVDQAKIDAVAGGAFRFLGPNELEDFFTGNDDDREDGGSDVPLFGDDLHGDDTQQKATELETQQGFVEGSRYEVVASIADEIDTDYYKFKSPDAVDGPSSVMTVFLRSLEAGRLIPRVTVLDEDGNLLPAEILVNGKGEYTLQVTGGQPDTEYLVRVEAADPNGLFATGNYQLTIVFGGVSTDLLTFANGTLDASQTNNAHTLFVAQTEFFHLALDVAPVSTTAPTLVWARILDANDQEVFRLASLPGDSRTDSGLFLAPGTYTVEVNGTALDGSPLENISYTLRGTVVSNLLAIDPLDPTDDPFRCPDGSGAFCYPGNIVSQNPYLWDLFLGSFPGASQLSSFDQVNLLLGDWWSWYWDSQTGNAPSLSFNDAYDLGGGGTLNVSADNGLLANDFDTDSDPMVAFLVDDVSQGTLTLNRDGAFTYEPPSPEFSGAVTFTYQVTDFFGQGTNLSTVTILVHAASDPWVVNRQVFYNGSRFDGQNSAANANDDLAIDGQKRALLQGATASRANYTSFSRGINGLIVDVQGLANPQGIGPDDFTFFTGNGDDLATWSELTAPVSVTVRPGAGAQGADRITIVLPDHVAEGNWLQTTVLANADTGLTSNDVFYFGNAVGETGNRVSNALVDSADVSLVGDHQRGPFDPAPITDPYDINRDGLVNATDIILARDHTADPGQALVLLDAPFGSGGTAAVASVTPASTALAEPLPPVDPVAKAVVAKATPTTPPVSIGATRPIASQTDVIGNWAVWSRRQIATRRRHVLKRLEKQAASHPIALDAVAARQPVVRRAWRAYAGGTRAALRAEASQAFFRLLGRRLQARHVAPRQSYDDLATGAQKDPFPSSGSVRSEAELEAIWGHGAFGG